MPEQNREGLSSMVVFLNGLIVVAESPRGHCVYVVGVVEAIMVVVVAGCCNQKGDLVEVIELGQLSQASAGEHQIAHLHDISAMEVIVVVYI